MCIRNKIFRILNQMSIATKFGLTAGLSILLIIMVALTGYLSLKLVRNAEKSTQNSSEIQRLVLEMDRGMENSRRLHADFFLQYPAIGLSKAHEKYAQSSIQRVSEVITVSQNLKNLIDRSEVSNALRKSRVDLNLYLSSAKRFAETSIESYELVTELAAPIRGLMAQMEEQLAVMHSEIDKFQVLEKICDKITDYTHTYWLKHQRFLMQSSFNEVFNLRKAIESHPNIESSKKQRVYAILDNYLNTGEKILGVDVKIKSIFNDFSLQASATGPISKTLVALAAEEMKKSQAKINHTYTLALIIMISITAIGLITAVTIARLLNNNITRKLIRLTQTTKEFCKGNLNVYASEESMDELGQLARTFNLMSTRIRELVYNLEDKVAQRTSDLESSNIKLINQVNERIKAEVSLKDTQAILQAAMDNSQAGIVIAEAPSGKINYINNAGLFITGDIEKKSLDALNVNNYNPSMQLYDLEGNLFGTGEDPLGYAIIHGKPCGREFIIRRADNDERTVFANAAPIFNDDNELKAAIIIFLDITDKKNAEMEKESLETQLRQAHKMEAIGTLAGGIAHDFNNILAAIMGYAELAKDDIPNTNPAIHQIDQVISAANRAKKLVKQILSFSRKSQKSRKPVQISTIVKDVLKLLRASIATTIEIRHNICNEPVGILGDSTQIHQVLMNLCTNAAQAMYENGGILEVNLDCVELTENDIVNEPGLIPGPFIKLSVKDTGSGIDSKIIDRIFDPYFTTKEVDKGSGMGLSVVHGIIKSYGGMIKVESTPNIGTSFIVYLPSIEVEIKPKTTPPADRPGGIEHILVVDDEKTLANVTRLWLERLGYRVTAITNSMEAFELFSSKPEFFDLVITDQTMPDMTGEEMAKEMIKVRSNIPIVLCTGYSSKINEQKAEEIGIKAFAMKPIDINELAKTVRQVLDKNIQDKSEFSQTQAL